MSYCSTHSRLVQVPSRLDLVLGNLSVGTNTSPKSSLSISARCGAELGIKAFELQLDYAARWDHKDPRILVELLALKEQFSLQYSGHAPYRDVDLASDNEITRTISLKSVIETLAFFAALNVKIVTVHTGINHGAGSVQNLTRSLATLVSKAQEMGITILLETAGRSPRFLTPTPSEYIQICQATGAGLTLDLIHLKHLAKDEFWSVFSGLLPLAQNLHIADSFDDLHQHYPLGHGTFPFADVFKILTAEGYQGQITVDAFDGHFTPSQYLTKAVDFKSYWMNQPFFA